jgi:hypothetical protein
MCATRQPGPQGQATCASMAETLGIGMKAIIIGTPHKAITTQHAGRDSNSPMAGLMLQLVPSPATRLRPAHPPAIQTCQHTNPQRACTCCSAHLQLQGPTHLGFATARLLPMDLSPTVLLRLKSETWQQRVEKECKCWQTRYDLDMHDWNAPRRPRLSQHTQEEKGPQGSSQEPARHSDTNSRPPHMLCPPGPRPWDAVRCAGPTLGRIACHAGPPEPPRDEEAQLARSHTLTIQLGPIRRLGLFRSRCTMGGDWECRCSMPHAAPIACRKHVRPSSPYRPSAAASLASNHRGAASGHATSSAFLQSTYLFRVSIQAAGWEGRSPPCACCAHQQTKGQHTGHHRSLPEESGREGGGLTICSRRHQSSSRANTGDALAFFNVSNSDPAQRGYGGLWETMGV